MHCRLFFVFSFFLYSELGIAGNDAWNCEKVQGKEWSCTSGPSADKASSPGSNLTKAKPSAPSISLPALERVKPAPVFVQPPRTVAKRPGWTCTSNDEGEDDTWNCSLIGPDPKGTATVVDGDEYSSGLLTAAFDFNQEQVFETLHSQLKYDPWESCLSSSRSGHKFVSGKDQRNTAPMDVTADYSEVFDKEITGFFGNVEIIRADQTVNSDMASYDTVSETMDAQGHVFYSEDDIALYSDTALLNLGTDEARLRNTLFISPSAPLRGSADVVYRDSKSLSRYKRVAFTSCRPGNQDWVIHADRLKMNKQSGKASAKHAWLEFKGVPFLYTPYISFPLDDRRLSGFLTPSFGISEDNGLDVTVPYYWNIAPNYDLTVWPRYMSKRGGMLGSEFRYLTKMTAGSIGLEFLPYDAIRKKPRYSATFKNKTKFTQNLRSNVDLNYVSDDEYFDELKSVLDVSHDRHIRSRADLSYSQEGIAFLSRLETYQTIDRNIKSEDRPYQKLPQVTLNLNHEFEEWPIDLEMENEYTNFYRNSRVGGHRVNLKPSVAFPIETAGSFIKPKFSLQHTQYELHDQLPGRQSSISRTLPIFSVDSGLIFERDLNFGDSNYLQTIEPRLFYLYIPKEDQDDIPLFDTALFDFNFNSMFRENRFSGTDRVQDANQVTIGLVSRLLDSETGQERLKFGLGGIYYFQDREVTLSGGSPERSRYSNVVAELNGKITDHWSFASGLQWNPQRNSFTRGQAEIRYRKRPGKILNLGYRYRKDDPDIAATIIQTDASFKWPIYDNWSGVGRWQYSHKFDTTKESFLGLEKESCCWRFRIIWRRYTDTLSDSSDRDVEQGIFLQLELKGLTSFGDNVDEFLEKNLKGYQRVE
jgi:LPS-assembly protein